MKEKNREVPMESKEEVERIKKILPNCTEREIYQALKDCKMDSDDAVERLLSQVETEKKRDSNLMEGKEKVEWIKKMVPRFAEEFICEMLKQCNMDSNLAIQRLFSKEKSPSEWKEQFECMKEMVPRFTEEDREGVPMEWKEQVERIKEMMPCFTQEIIYEMLEQCYIDSDLTLPRLLSPELGEKCKFSLMIQSDSSSGDDSSSVQVGEKKKKKKKKKKKSEEVPMEEPKEKRTFLTLIKDYIVNPFGQFLSQDREEETGKKKKKKKKKRKKKKKSEKIHLPMDTHSALLSQETASNSGSLLNNFSSPPSSAKSSVASQLHTTSLDKGKVVVWHMEDDAATPSRSNIRPLGAEGPWSSPAVQAGSDPMALGNDEASSSRNDSGNNVTLASSEFPEYKLFPPPTQQIESGIEEVKLAKHEEVTIAAGFSHAVQAGSDPMAPGNNVALGSTSDDFISLPDELCSNVNQLERSSISEMPSNSGSLLKNFSSPPSSAKSSVASQLHSISLDKGEEVVRHTEDDAATPSISLDKGEEVVRHTEDDTATPSISLDKGEEVVRHMEDDAATPSRSNVRALRAKGPQSSHATRAVSDPMALGNNVANSSGSDSGNNVALGSSEFLEYKLFPPPTQQYGISFTLNDLVANAGLPSELRRRLRSPFLDYLFVPSRSSTAGSQHPQASTSESGPSEATPSNSETSCIDPFWDPQDLVLYGPFTMSEIESDIEEVKLAKHEEVTIAAGFSHAVQAVSDPMAPGNNVANSSRNDSGNNVVLGSSEFLEYKLFSPPTQQQREFALSTSFSMSFTLNDLVANTDQPSELHRPLRSPFLDNLSVPSRSSTAGSQHPQTSTLESGPSEATPSISETSYIDPFRDPQDPVLDAPFTISRDSPIQRPERMSENNDFAARNNQPDPGAMSTLPKQQQVGLPGCMPLPSDGNNQHAVMPSAQQEVYQGGSSTQANGNASGRGSFQGTGRTCCQSPPIPPYSPAPFNIPWTRNDSTLHAQYQYRNVYCPLVTPGPAMSPHGSFPRWALLPPNANNWCGGEGSSQANGNASGQGSFQGAERTYYHSPRIQPYSPGPFNIPWTRNDSTLHAHQYQYRNVYRPLVTPGPATTPHGSFPRRVLLPANANNRRSGEGLSLQYANQGCPSWQCPRDPGP